MHLENIIRQKQDEKIMFALRRHPIVFFAQILFLLVLLAIPAVIYFMITWVAADLMNGQYSRPLLLLFASGYYLIIWMFFMTEFVDYYLDSWVITSDRVLSIEQRGLFSRTVSELDLAKIQDVTSEIKGILPSIFGYGDIYVQTAGEVERFVFEQVPDPHNVRKYLLDLIEADRRRQIGLEKTEE